MTSDVEPWLRTTWLPNGPTVCVLEGGSGVGKSAIADRLLLETSLTPTKISASGGNLGFDDTMLELALALEANGIDSMSNSSTGDLIVGLEEALLNPILIMIDEFDELVNAKTGLPPTQFIELLSRTSAKPTIGRLLLISNINLAEGAWQEKIAFRTVSPPSEQEALRFLEDLLRTRRRDDEVPRDLRLDVVRWLGCNPRALMALVACMQFYSLEEIIELEQDAWGIRDQVVSSALIQQLEERFTSRTLGRLEPAALLLLQFLSVFRKPFTRDALEFLPAAMQSHFNELVTRFLIGRYRRWFSLSRYAREIARAQIEKPEANKQYKSAHNLAANYYVGHFKGDHIDIVKHSGEFVEARFHLPRCGRQDEFEGLARHVRSSLLLGAADLHQRFPTDLRDRDQLIMSLGAALSIDSSPYVPARTFLARLLVDRNERDDRLRALQQVVIATRTSSDQTAWMLRVKLAAEVDTAAAFAAAADQALKTVPAGSRGAFYYQIAKVHALAGRMRQAFDVVDAGTNSIRNPSDLSELFALRAAFNARQGDYKTCVSLLFDFLKNRSFKEAPSGVRQRVYERTVLLAFASLDRSVLENLLALLATREDAKYQHTLCKLAILQVTDRYDELSLVAETVPNYPAEVAQRAFSFICSGEPRLALDMLTARYQLKGAQAWLWALTAYSNGQLDLAAKAATVLTGEAVAPDAVTPRLLISLWYDIGNGLDKNPAYWHPRLPRALTGLREDLVRLQVPSARLDVRLIDDAVFAVNPMRDGQIMTVRNSAPSESDSLEAAQMDRRGDATTISFAPVIYVEAHGGKVSEGPKYHFTGPVGAAGDNATASNFIQTYQQLSQPALREQLIQVRDAMRSGARTADQDVAVAAMSQAEAAIGSGDVKAAEGHLAKAGKWAWSTATAIGAGVAAAAIKAAIGF